MPDIENEKAKLLFYNTILIFLLAHMARYGLLLILFILLITGVAVAQENFIVKQDMQPTWLVYKDKIYSSFNQSDPSIRTIYFSLKPNDYAGDYLVLEGTNHFSVWINGR